MASWVFSSIQSLSSKVLEAVRSTQYQQDPASSAAADQNEGVRKDLEKLSRMLVRIQSVLQDAEEREIHDRSVRLWLTELRGVAYQAEDVLDEFHYEVLKSIVEGGDAAIEMYYRTNGSKRKFSEICTSSFLASYSSTINEASIPDSMAENIKGITQNFEEISNARRDLHLREEDGTRLSPAPEIRPPTSSHVDERAIFGRNAEKSKIISLMNPSSGPEFMVLPIVGMGGIGKTTLAQLVYNDSRIRMLFNKRCWVYVSEDFDLVRITKAIVDSVSDSPSGFSELSQLQDALKDKLRAHPLFLVLDDVWNDKTNLWELFRAVFFYAKTVRILVTTRNASVAKIMQTTEPFQLGSLPEKNCWWLFKHFAFGNRTTDENANLHKIGRGIVKKCKGSPLAIKALGGILRYEKNEEKWTEILTSDISQIDEIGQIMPELLLSYQKLPLHLRQCFLYLSMFPKGTPFEKDMVVRLWMAQGYINGSTKNLKTLEEMGHDYFDELQGRSLIHQEPFGKYVLHDLIHDVARSISQEAYQPVLEYDQQWGGLCKVYHLYVTKEDKFLGSFLPPSNYSSIRTVVKEYPRTQNFDHAIFDEIFSVRVLHLRYNSWLPNTLGTLKHLRYLFVADSLMEMLPETICLLYNLQTLDLHCFYLQELPETIKNLVNLRFFQLTSGVIQQLPESIFLLRNLHTLLLRYCGKLKELPRGIEQLTRLRILDLPMSLISVPFGIGKLTTLKPLSGNFSVMGHGMVGGLGELKDMNKLSGLLHISGLKNICDVENSCTSNLASKPNLHKLILNFQETQYCTNEGLHLAVCSSNNAKNKNDESHENMQEVVLETLQPHGNLTKLKILNYGGKKFPSWLFNSLLPKLTAITLDLCTEPDFLPPFCQLRNLRFLKISGGTSISNLVDEPKAYSLLTKYGSSKLSQEVSYPSLEELSLRNMLNLVEWQALEGDFPRLKRLIIDNCPKLLTVVTIPKEVRLMLITECGCHELQFSSESKIQNVLISKCQNLITVHSTDSSLRDLVKISVYDCPRLRKFTNIYKFLGLKNISLDCCPELWSFPAISEELEILKIQNCGLQEIMLPTGSRTQIISNCLKLNVINWSDKGRNYIEELTIEYCPKLKFLTIPSGIAKLKIHECGFNEMMLPVICVCLTISNCLDLTLVNWKDRFSNSVREVAIEFCPKLKVLAFPSVIRKLKIHNCDFREIMFESISENISISNCLELNSFKWRNGGLNYIKKVSFEYCPKMELVTIPVGTLELTIHECGFHEIIVPSVSEKLTISNCLELNSIIYRDGCLNSTELVTFRYCPKLEVLEILAEIRKLNIENCGFRELIFQSRSQYITISDCQELTSVSWRDGHLYSIEELTFIYCPKLSIPTIPIGIKKLNIAYCGIKEINLPLQSSIEMVNVSHCSVLTSIRLVKIETLFQAELFKDGPELQKRLKNLRISCCPILQFPSKDVLHSMTQRAEIYGCPNINLGKGYAYQRDTMIKELNLIGNDVIHLSLASVNSTIPLEENPLRLFFSNKDSLEGESFTCTPSIGMSCQCIMLNLASLVILNISRCSMVISVTGLDNLNNLKRLSISYCTELCDWKDKRLPLSLKFLELESCDKLSSLPLLSVENHRSFLKVLAIRDCPLLTILEGFHGLMNLKTIELLNCSNIYISFAAQSQLRPHHITICGCPLMKNWFQLNNITYYEVEFNPTDNPQDDSEAEQENAGSTTKNPIY